MDLSTDPLSRALQLLQSALELLDQADAPADIGAHLDLTIVRVRELLDAPAAGDGVNRSLAASSRKGMH